MGASVLTPSEKSSINTNRKSTTRNSNDPKMNIVRCPWAPKGASKTQSVQNLDTKLR